MRWILENRQTLRELVWRRDKLFLTFHLRPCPQIQELKARWLHPKLWNPQCCCIQNVEVVAGLVAVFHHSPINHIMSASTHSQLSVIDNQIDHILMKLFDFPFTFCWYGATFRPYRGIKLHWRHWSLSPKELSGQSDHHGFRGQKRSSTCCFSCDAISQ